MPRRPTRAGGVLSSAWQSKGNFAPSPSRSTSDPDWHQDDDWGKEGAWEAQHPRLRTTSSQSASFVPRTHESTLAEILQQLNAGFGDQWSTIWKAGLAAVAALVLLGIVSLLAIAFTSRWSDDYVYGADPVTQKPPYLHTQHPVLESQMDQVFNTNSDAQASRLDSHMGQSGEIELLSHEAVHTQLGAQGAKVQPRQLGAQLAGGDSAGDSFASSGYRGVSLHDVKAAVSQRQNTDMQEQLSGASDRKRFRHNTAAMEAALRGARLKQGAATETEVSSDAAMGQHTDPVSGTAADEAQWDYVTDGNVRGARKRRSHAPRLPPSPRAPEAQAVKAPVLEAVKAPVLASDELLSVSACFELVSALPR
ncbi:hypothetical protein WJX73_000830 [Symbiochloris irregularis]|uniref:Transmembrane protein n=1 Tax=Symbiochloris irregularis TaxID=706552 RepID=A0AAW1NWR4_9CHLO